MIKVNGHEVKFERFPNGETNLIHESIKLRNGMAITDVHFKFESNASLIDLMFVKDYLDTHCKSDMINLLIYYMPYSRMDRVENKSAFTLKTIAKKINDMNFNKIEVIEPHSDVTTALLDKAEAKYINFFLVEIAKQKIGFNEENDYLMFPDAGASKRYSKMRAKNVLIGNKMRDFETGKILSFDLTGNKSKVVETRAPKVIIVDDLSSYGGTFVHSAKALKDVGFAEIHLLVAHAENSIFKGELFDHVDKVFTTDSILTEQDNWENQKYKPQLEIFELEGIVKSNGYQNC